MGDLYVVLWSSDSSGNVYDGVLQLSPGGAQTTTAVANTFPDGLAMDAAGNFYVSGKDLTSCYGPIFNGQFAGTCNGARGFALDGEATLYVVDGTGRLWKVPQGSSPALIVTASIGITTWSPSQIAVDGGGNAYVIDASTGSVYELGGVSFVTALTRSDGACGAANNQILPAAPAQPADLCANGASSSVSGTGPWTWTCTGLNGGATAFCATSSGPLAGSCGPANGAAFSSVPTPAAGLCATGLASAILGAGPWNWNCGGLNGGATAPCSASVTASKVNGACGPSSGAALGLPPTDNLCTAGAASALTGTGPWSWTCSGFNGGSAAHCASIVPATGIDGACGASAGVSFTSPPSVNLCAAGSYSGMSGSGPWTWSCTGLGAGSTAACSTAAPSITPGSATTAVSGLRAGALASDSVGNVFTSYLCNTDHTCFGAVSNSPVPLQSVWMYNYQAWTAYGNSQFCYINSINQTTPVAMYHCGGASLGAAQPVPDVWMVADSTGSHVYLWSAGRVLDRQTVVLSSGQLLNPFEGALAIDPAGNLYLMNRYSIARLNPVTQTLTTVAPNLQNVQPAKLVIGNSGNFYVADYVHVYEIDAATGFTTILNIPNITQPSDIAVDGQGNVFVLDMNNGHVTEVANVDSALGGGGGGGNGLPAKTPVNGRCGSAATSTTTLPTQNLCSKGTPSAVAGTGTGPFSWTCAGQNSGGNTSCSTYPAVLTVTANNL